MNHDWVKHILYVLMIDVAVLIMQFVEKQKFSCAVIIRAQLLHLPRHLHAYVWSDRRSENATWAG